MPALASTCEWPGWAALAARGLLSSARSQPCPGPPQEMNGELCEQVPRIGRLQDRAAVTHDQLGSLAREAQRI